MPYADTPSMVVAPMIRQLFEAGKGKKRRSVIYGLVEEDSRYTVGAGSDAGTAGTAKGVTIQWRGPLGNDGIYTRTHSLDMHLLRHSKPAR